MEGPNKTDLRQTRVLGLFLKGHTFSVEYQSVADFTFLRHVASDGCTCCDSLIIRML